MDVEPPRSAARGSVTRREEKRLSSAAEPRSRPGGAPRLFSHASHRELVLYAAFAIGLVLSVVLLGRHLGHQLHTLESWIGTLGPWGVVAFVVLFAVTTSLFVPDTLLCVGAGALFGLPLGTAAVAAASLLAAAMQFALGRGLLHARVQRALAGRPLLAAIQRAVHRDERRLQMLLRLTPLNPATIGYVLSAAGVPFFGYLLACFAHIPILAIEVYLGHAGKDMVRMASRDTWTAALHDVGLVGGVAVCVLVMILVSRIARRAVLQAVAEVEGEETAEPR